MTSTTQFADIDDGGEDREFTAKQVVRLQDKLFPGAGRWLVSQVGGTFLYVPKRFETPEDIVKLFSDHMAIDDIAKKYNYNAAYVTRMIKSRI